MLIDTHAHLYASQFEPDFEEVMSRITENGIGRILLPNIDSTSLRSMNLLCEQYPNLCRQMMGLHPCSVQAESIEAELELVYKELKTGKYIAVGEIGIDLYWDKSTFDVQKEAFRRQMDWALEFELPIAIHARESFDEIFELMAPYSDTDLYGVFHCFTGTVHQAEYIRQNHPRFYYGLGGVVTFKNSGMDKVVPKLSRDRIVLETDAPYLAPVPYRGKRNEPSYILDVAQKVADLLEMPVEKLSELTTQNAEKLFNLT